jgi:hypothetical protein
VSRFREERTIVKEVWDQGQVNRALRVEINCLRLEFVRCLKLMSCRTRSNLLINIT